MRIMVKFLWNNVKENKFRSFLIIFAVALSCALSLVANTLSKTIDNSLVRQIRSQVGSAEICVMPDSKLSTVNVDPSFIKKLSEKLEYMVPVVVSQGMYSSAGGENVKLAMNGYNLKDLMLMNPIELKKDLELGPFTGNKVIISEKLAEKYGLDVGQPLTVKMANQSIELKIVAIGREEGLFGNESLDFSVVLPIETMQKAFNLESLVTFVYTKPAPGVDKASVMKYLSDNLTNYIVKDIVSQDYIERNTAAVTRSLSLLCIVVLLLSSFIIYTAVKVIVLNRLPVVGTFRSIGATRLTGNFILICESLLYAVIGFMSGIMLGMGALYLLALIYSKSLGIFRPIITVDAVDVIIAFAICVLLSVVSSIVPVLQVNNYSLKELILNSPPREKKLLPWKGICAAILILAAVFGLLIRKAGDIQTGYEAVVYIICVIAGGMLAVPFIVRLFAEALWPFYGRVFGNEGVLALRNLRTDRNLMNNASMAYMGVAVMLLVNILCSSLGNVVNNSVKAYKYDVLMEGWSMDDDFRKASEQVQGIGETYGIYTAYGAKIDGTSDMITRIDGVDPEKFFEFYDYEIDGNPGDVVNKLGQGRNIILSEVIKDQYNFKVGDNITVVLDNTKLSYRIIGFFNTFMYNGSFALVSDELLKRDLNTKLYSQILVKTTKEPSVVKKALQDKYSSKYVFIKSIDEAKRDYAKANRTTINMLGLFTIIIMIIGSFGIVNNYIISYMNRRHSFAILNSIGMTRGQNIKMLLIEGAAVGTIGSISGMLGGLSLLNVISVLIIALTKVEITMNYQVSTLIGTFCGGILITTIASTVPALNASRINAVESLKLE
ncbi:MAG: FtsX-like permease family protein [Bacillota bacterium]|nr:FtsX-like permease family protein [Bacillota bacterium]